MALLNLCYFSAWTLCLLFLATEPYHVQIWVDGSSDRKNVADLPSKDGICASFVVVHGYKCQELEVTTKDGYILSLQRIPEGRAKASGSVTKKEPVIMQHGVLVDGMTWLLNSPEQNLPLILADNGFDVWIANARGTKYSRQHTSLNSSDPEFWNWSWDEMVTYDLPAIFDYVSNQTGQKMNYLGHSLGTLIALASFSEMKLVNQLKSAAFLSPIAYLNNMNSRLLVLAGQITYWSELLPHSSAFHLFLNNEPQSTSAKNLVHLSQTIRTGDLTKFDYGNPQEN
ncbi:AB-hydrolase lipase domain [Sesbania bispinosa]|nr:AB-hydrolase lipase domain [Sesbania bispinosa]